MQASNNKMSDKPVETTVQAKAGAGSSRSPAFSPLSLTRTLWKHKVMVAAVWVGGSVATFVLAGLLPKTYKGEVLILVDSQEIPEKYVEPTVTSAMQERLATLNQQILSATRLTKIISALDLYREERQKMAPEEVIELMRKKISVRAERGLARERAGAFRVSFEDEVPAVAAKVANELASVYIQENLQFRERQAEGTSQFLESQLTAAKKELDEQEAKVSRYKLARNGELPEQENALNAAMTRMQLELSSNQDALNRAEQTKALLENSLAIAQGSVDAMTKATSAGQSAAASAIASLAPRRRRSDVIRDQLDAALARYSERHPDVLALRQQLDSAIQAEAAQAEAAQEAAKDVGNGRNLRALPPEVAREVLAQNERIESTRTQVELASRDIARLRQERGQMLKELAVLQGRVDRLPLREQEMAALTRDYEISKANYQSLLQKKLSAEMAADMERRQQSERFTVLDPATVPETPSAPNLPLAYAGGSILALMLGIGGAFTRDLASDVLLGEWELPPGTIVLARVPRIRAGAVMARSEATS